MLICEVTDSSSQTGLQKLLALSQFLLGRSDDENAKKGYCLYNVGCKGPSTYNACGVMKWNNGVSYPIQSGHPCIGCSEENFWDNGRLYDRASAFAGFGIEANADDIGKAALVATGVGIAAHAVATNIRKKKLITDHEDEGKESVKNLDI